MQGVLIKSILLALTLSIGALGAHAQTGDPSAMPHHPVVKSLRAITPDELDIKLVNNIHYVASDESHHHLFKKDIDGLGGAFIGIGTNQNYTMLPWAKPDLAIMMDFDQMVIDVHELYRLAFLNAETPKEFMQLWYARSKKTFRSLIKASCGDDKAKAKRLRKAYRYSRSRIVKALKRTKKTQRKSRTNSYLGIQSEYDYIVKMFKEDRIVFVRGDLTKNGAMKTMGEVLKKHGQVVRVYHPSNAEQYFPYTQNYRNNVRSLPHDARSKVVRTRAWAKFVELTPDEVLEMEQKLTDGKIKLKPNAPELRTPPKRKEIYYTYAVQTQADFLKWLGLEKTKSVRDMLPYKSRVEYKRYEIGSPN